MTYKSFYCIFALEAFHDLNCLPVFVCLYINLILFVVHIVVFSQRHHWIFVVFAIASLPIYVTEVIRVFLFPFIFFNLKLFSIRSPATHFFFEMPFGNYLLIVLKVSRFNWILERRTKKVDKKWQQTNRYHTENRRF